ncbi:MAG TPA: Pr6Pr family membrane protein [Dinghuibacter sp.]|jgi:hypothetical protein|uniref:Pr6Pr family membrane protein n=1 Tax=Dinghuibacter sp. TaxID=2024697 RepID=UPI002C47CC34|nr:Pr6Pr family membrane protein [Dinghuibacter sp.]HTJ14492.1 Pr6Pr family membrane protein [Dinghuibacter sp.]
MFTFSTRYQQALMALVALMSAAALIFQGHLVLVHSPLPPGVALFNFLSYFTILTSAIASASLWVGLFASTSGQGPASRLNRFFRRPSVETSIAGCLLNTCLVYHVALAPLMLHHGVHQWWGVLHDALPAAYILYWFLFVPKGQLHWGLPVIWMAYPLGYWLVTLWRGAATGFYPYPYLDVVGIGTTRVLLNLFCFMGSLAVVFYTLVAVDKWMGKHFDRIFLRK